VGQGDEVAATTGFFWVTTTPFLTATISARIETAISAGVRLPMSRPIGPCRRAISAALRSNSASRSLRLAVLPREPSAPM
jgi:hypothetical protein